MTQRSDIEEDHFPFHPKLKNLWRALSPVYSLVKYSSESKLLQKWDSSQTMYMQILHLQTPLDEKVNSTMMESLRLLHQGVLLDFDQLWTNLIRMMVKEEREEREEEVRRH